MTINDITNDAVVAACREYDELGKTKFLKKYGFGSAKTYKLYLNQKYYDSKAILGAAHGYISPMSEPLKNTEFFGGIADTVRVLERLGFEVVSDPPPTQNPDWTEAEIVLATQFYRRYSPRIPGKTSDNLIGLADEIRTAAFMQGLHGNETFRNPNGTYMKLMELRKYDQSYAGVGLGHERERDIEAKIFRMSDEDLKFVADNVRVRISNFKSTGETEQSVLEPKSLTLRSLMASSDPVESQLGRTLHYWQQAKRKRGKRAFLGREPAQIKERGAVEIIEQRVRSGANGFDDVASTDESYEKIVVENSDRFADDVIEIAKTRLAEYDLASPTDDHEELEAKTKEIIARPHMIDEPPAGNSIPRREVATVVVYLRDPRVVAYTQVRANGICELCAEPAPFSRPDKTPYLETHHVVPLAEGGPDTPSNCAGVCPNCHRALHSAANKDELAKLLLAKLTIH